MLEYRCTLHTNHQATPINIMTAASKSLTTAILFLTRSSSSFTQGTRNHPYRAFSTKQFGTTQKSTMTTSTNSPCPTPPIPRREEDRVVYAGVAPPGWDPKMPRQSNDSTEKLIDPPVPIPDPYGWLRDDKRESKEILDYLKAENDYSQEVTKHLKGLQDTLYEGMVYLIYICLK